MVSPLGSLRAVQSKPESGRLEGAGTGTDITSDVTGGANLVPVAGSKDGNWVKEGTGWESASFREPYTRTKEDLRSSRFCCILPLEATKKLQNGAFFPVPPVATIARMFSRSR